MSEEDISQMIANHRAETWTDVHDGDAIYDDHSVDALERLEAYVDYCFETYDVVSKHLDRERVQTCIADWDRRRGQARYGGTMDKRRFGKRVPTKYETRKSGHHILFLAEALIGVPPEDDKGVGWKACVRHELGHIIDFEQRGTSDHGPKFKKVMQKFGHDTNDGQSKHGWAPSVHR